MVHRTTQYLNNFTEQSHRAIKQRYYPMRGFASFESASRFCTAFNELHNYFRIGRTSASPAEQRGLFMFCWRELIANLSVA